MSAPLKPDSITIKPADAFVGNGYYFTTPKRIDTTWGSYVPVVGDGAIGEMFLHFSNDGGAKKIDIPVAGYPLRDGISIEIEQNGKYKKASIESNPGEAWGTAYGKVGSGDFSIILRDSSRSTWVAIAGPTVRGKLDGITNRVLSRYYLFILCGVIGIIILIIQNGIITLPKSVT
jgi:hypothetical protein